MRRRRLLQVLFLAAILPSLAIAAGPEKKAEAPPIDDLIADLDSNQYAARKRATLALIEAGESAVSSLVTAAIDGTLEVRIRVFHILQEMYAGSRDDATISAAERALETLAESTNRGLSVRAERVLDSNYELREKRALAQIGRLGGVVTYRDANDPLYDPEEPEIAFVLLGTQWKGGDAGLKYLKRLDRLRMVYLSGTGKSAPISKEAEVALQAAMPNLMIQRRGAAYLGIGGGLHPRGCQVLTVKEGTAADKAGLQQLDVITGFGDKEVPDFDTLIGQIKEFSPGEEVKVRVLRGAETLTLTVVMGEWK